MYFQISHTTYIIKLSSQRQIQTFHRLHIGEQETIAPRRSDDNYSRTYFVRINKPFELDV